MASPLLPFGAVAAQAPAAGGTRGGRRGPLVVAAALLLLCATACFVVQSAAPRGGGGAALLQGRAVPEAPRGQLAAALDAGWRVAPRQALAARAGPGRGARLQDEEGYGYGYDDEEEEKPTDDWGIDYGTDDTHVDCSSFGVCGDGAWRPPECPCEPEPEPEPAPEPEPPAPPPPSPNEAGNQAAAATLDPVVDELKKEEQELMDAKDFETMGVVREAEIVLKKAEGEFTRREAEEEEAKLKEEIPELEAKNNTAAIKIIEDVVEALVVAEKVKTGVATLVAGNHTPPGVTIAPPPVAPPVWSHPPAWYLQPPWWAQYPYNQTGGQAPLEPPAWYREPPAWYYQAAPGQPPHPGSPPAPPAPPALPPGHPGHGWLPYPYGTPPGLPANVVAMKEPPKDDKDQWLSQDQGRMWLDTPNGRAWLGSSGGQEWLYTTGGEQWLWSPWGGRWLTTPTGMQWAARNPQMAAQFMPPQGWGYGGPMHGGPMHGGPMYGGNGLGGPEHGGGAGFGGPAHGYYGEAGNGGPGYWGHGQANGGWGQAGQGGRGWGHPAGSEPVSNRWGPGQNDRWGAGGHAQWGGAGAGGAGWGLDGNHWDNGGGAGGRMGPGAAAAMHPVVQASEKEVTNSLDKMLHQAKQAQDVYDRVEETMENLRSAVSMIKEFISQVKPVEHPEGHGIWGGNERQVQYTAETSDPAGNNAVSSLWMKNALYNTEKKLNKLQEEARTVSQMQPLDLKKAAPTPASHSPAAAHEEGAKSGHTGSSHSHHH